ncbi:hypothetical protein ES703_95566 [subsurface metagenome]
MEPSDMKKHQPATLKCTHRTAGLVFIILGTFFLLTGCAALYKIIGLTPEQTAEQVAQDQDATQQIIQQVRWTTHEIITTTLAGAGAILSGLLTRWLGTERKITTAMITGIEKSTDSTVKQNVKAKAIAAGVEPQLAARVRALT